MGIIERIGALTGSEAAKAINLAHETFQRRLGVHGHHGRALIETFVEVCRNHPNLMGLAAGILVEQLLVREKHHHDAQLAAEAANGGHAPEHREAPAHKAHEKHDLALPKLNIPTLRRGEPAHTPHHMLRMAQIRPGRLAIEVFGALLLLKFSAGVAKAFRRKNKREVWFEPAAKIHSISAALATYYGAKAIKSKRVSAWRNAAAVLFFTDAVKPLLKVDKRFRATAPLPAAPAAPPPAAIPPPPAAAALEPQPAPHHEEPQPVAAHHDAVAYEEPAAAHVAYHGQELNGHGVHAHDSQPVHDLYADEPPPEVVNETVHEVAPPPAPAIHAPAGPGHLPETAFNFHHDAAEPDEPVPVQHEPAHQEPPHYEPAQPIVHHQPASQAMAIEAEPPPPAGFHHEPARHVEELEPEPDAPL